LPAQILTATTTPSVNFGKHFPASQDSLVSIYFLCYNYEAAILYSFVS
jgi:hypothetical protein